MMVNDNGYYKLLFGKVPNVRSVSNYVNPKLNDYVNKSKAPGSGYGVCILDFIDESLSKAIVDSNVFNQYIIAEPVWIWR